ncbi:MAG: hypothetical protein LW845_10230 [Flammeovirgaceae bacterium]|nr:hypothetical protein [Flammeovirgaceae bacterium]
MAAMALVVDTFLFALAWAVQLVVYPGFRWVNTAANPHWHRTYTSRIVVLTLPTMVAQLVLHGLIAYRHPGWINALGLLLVLISWAITFGSAVRVHQKISIQGPRQELLDSLMAVHGFRTGVWSIVFLIQIKQTLL